MPLKTEVTILGCGGSSGVPVIGRGWGACDPTNPKNRRTRSSILLRRGGTSLLVDTTPDFRAQALRAGIDHLDAVLYTHAHADHLHGIDDLRWINQIMHRDLPIYGKAEHLELIKERFSYVFDPLAETATLYYKPVLQAREITAGQNFSIGDFSDIQPLEQDHGYGLTLGFRFDNVAYSTDVVRMPQESLERLHDLDLWIVDCLWTGRAHRTHAHWELTEKWIKTLAPKRVLLTHMSHLLDYDEINALTPDFVEPSYDGLTLSIPLRG